MSTEITVPSGATVVINHASWKDAKRLKQAIEREIIVGGEINLSTVLLVDSSTAVDEALAPCLARCLYNNEKITDQIFDDPKARGDYYDIAMACVKENLAPLGESLLSKLRLFGLVKQAKNPQNDGPKSESTTSSDSSQSS